MQTHCVMMRSISKVVGVLGLVGLVACTSASPSAPAPANVREALATSTPFVINPAHSGGVMIAKAWSKDGWTSTPVAVDVERGGVTLHVREDADGALAIDELDVAIAPIDLRPRTQATLDHLALSLTQAPVTAETTTWHGDDAATASLPLALTLDWSITTATSSTPLGPQHLPAMATTLDVIGDGPSIDGTVVLTLPGRVWSWAGLFEVEDLRLTLDVGL